MSITTSYGQAPRFRIGTVAVILLAAAAASFASGWPGGLFSGFPYDVLPVAVVGAAIAAAILLVRRPGVAALTAIVGAVPAYLVGGIDASALLPLLGAAIGAELPLAIGAWRKYTVPRAVFAALLSAVLNIIGIYVWTVATAASEEAAGLAAMVFLVPFIFGPAAVVGAALASLVIRLIERRRATAAAPAPA